MPSSRRCLSCAILGSARGRVVALVFFEPTILDLLSASLVGAVGFTVIS